MNRPVETPGGFEHRAFGAPGATRTIVVLRTGSTAMLDPDPPVTARRAIHILAVGLTDDDIHDPGGYRGETPVESMSAALETLVREQADRLPVGIVGCGAAGPLALRLAAALEQGVDRLALIAVPTPESPLDRDIAAEIMARVTAKTLIMNGVRDPDAAAASARFLHDGLTDSRVEMVPDADRSAEERLGLATVWDRVLSHVAPGTKLPG